MRRKLFALEEFSDINDEELESAEQEADDAHEELEESADSGLEISEALEEAAEELDTIDRVGDVLDSSLQDDGEGINETSAEIAEVTMEAICNRLGMKYTRLLPATEAFGSKSSRRVATEGALSSIKETGLKILNWFIKAYQSLIDNIKVFIFKMVNTTRAVKKDIILTVKSIRGNSSRTQPIENASLAKDFRDYKTAEKIVGNTKNILGVGGVSKQIATEIKKMLSDETTSGFGGDDIELGSSLISGIKQYTDIELLAGRKIVITDEKESFNISIEQPGLKHGETIESIPGNELQKFGRDLIELCTHVEKLQKDLDDYSKQTSGIKQLVERMKKRLEEKEGSNFHHWRKILTEYNNISSFIAFRVPSLAIQTVKAGSKYLKASVGSTGVAVVNGNPA